jgi:hypothetical protein
MTADAAADHVDAGSPAATQSRWFGWLLMVTLIIVAPIVLILAGGVTVFLWWQLAEARAASEVEAEVVRIKSQGHPITIWDLYQYHRVPTGTKDITADWLAVLAMYGGRVAADETGLPIVGTGNVESLAADAPDSSLAAAEAYLQKHDDKIQAALAAGRLEGECRLPTTFESGSAGMLPQIQNVRDVARHMSLRTKVTTARGNSDAAIESIETTLATARAMEHQLSLVEQLVQTAILGIALFDIDHLLSQAELTDEQLARLQADVRRLDLQGSFTTSLIGERGVGYQAFHHYAAPPAAGAATAADPMAGGELFRAADCHMYLLLMQDLIDASQLSPPQSLQQRQVADARLAKAVQSDPLAGMKYQLSQMTLPSIRAAFEANARTHAVRNLILAKIAAKRYQLKHGRLPPDLDSLTEFLPETPLDPFDGQPVRMRVTDSELVLYSIGRDLRDDGAPPAPSPHEPDIVVRLKTK